MRVYDFRELDSTAVSLFFQDGKNPVVKVRSELFCEGRRTHSGGLAGSMMTDSLDLSSVTR